MKNSQQLASDVSALESRVNNLPPGKARALAYERLMFVRCELSLQLTYEWQQRIRKGGAK